jgi:predicted O-methyltransferase YrrM
MSRRYLLAIISDATRIIECGTSFGLATIYIALALNQSTPGKQENDRRIITIEKDGSKVAKAKAIWTEGKDVESRIDAREGNLLEVLEEETLPPVIDLVFLDGNLTPYAVCVDSVANSTFKPGLHYNCLL